MNKNYHIGGSNLIDAKLGEHQMWGTKQCPSCGYKLERKPQDWLGLPAGVKFDPTDQELIDHLEGQVKVENFKSHPLIDEFIPTIEGEDGICYTHPEKLPGVTRGGLSRHFFHRPSKAYTTGTRKRRKIQTECDLQGSETRWHKTGKTRPVMANGKQKGCKKILVLYTNFGKHRKPVKTNWVMHQYHLGQFEEEKEGELVVSKIFYQTQPRQSNWSDQIIRTIKGGGKGSGEPNSRRESNSGSCSSSKEIGTQRDELSGGGVSTGVSSYNSMDIQQLNSDHFSFVPFRKSFDEVGLVEEAIFTTREYTSCRRAWDENEDHHHRQHISTFHVSLPSFPISSTISPPHHHTSIVLDEGSYNNPSTIPKNDKFRQQHHDHQHKVVGGSSPSGLEEMLMFYTSSSDIKEERAMTNPQGAEWLKYSSYLPDPDNQDHHG